MWLSDRPLTQQRLATDLANLISILAPATVVPFLSAFWTTMAREWAGIDVLRMDKMLLLVRKYVHASFAYLARSKWTERDLVERYMGVLAAIPLSPADGKVPDGLRYHILDVYVEELDRVDTPRSGVLPLEVVLGPLRALERESPNKAVRRRAKEALADERLEGWEGMNTEGNAEGKSGGEDNNSGGDEWGGIDE